jgi:HPt (histidine-containing phosphotransfer) domain-containing protein
MRDALERDDREALWQQAHALRGSSAMLRASVVAELCGLLERSSDGVAKAVLVERVADAYARTVEPLRAGLP